jgi:hypothetical protein
VQARDVLAKKQRIAIGDGCTQARQEIAAHIAIFIIDIDFFVGRTLAAVFGIGRRHMPPSHLISKTIEPHWKMSAENALSTSG